MADVVTSFFETIMNGKTAGIPNLLIILIVAGIFIIIYLVATRKNVKEFKPLDIKKETKRRFKREYKYFGTPVNKNVFNVGGAKPVAFAIGYMKVVEMKEMKRLEPIWTGSSKEKIAEKHDVLSKSIYEKEYSQLNEVEKRQIDEVSKEELRNEKVEEMEKGEKVRIVRGRKEVEYSVPIPLYMFKMCGTSFFAKALARFIGYGTDWFLFNENQITFDDSRISINADLQRRTPNEIFVFSKAGENLVEDISYGAEREAMWQETANQIPRAVHFDTEASKALIYRREDAKIEKEKRKAQSETHEF